MRISDWSSDVCSSDLKAMAMGPQLQRQWTERSRAFLTAQQDMTDTASTLSSASKVLRMLLQSLVLTAGALLVIEGKATGGVIFASSILGSRALAPVEQAIGNWRGLVAARQSWHRLEGHLATLRQDLPRRSAEHTSDLQSQISLSYAVFFLQTN